MNSKILSIDKAIKNGNFNEAINTCKKYLIDPSSLQTAKLNKLIANREKKLVYDKAKLELFLDTGWIDPIKNKKSWSIFKPKPHDIAFEQRVWGVLAKMNFNLMNNVENNNSDSSFKIPYKINNIIKAKQIDVIAADDEVVLVIECKSKEVRSAKASDHNEPVNAWSNIKEPIRKSLFQIFGRDKKIIFIWSTNNIRYTKNMEDVVKANEWTYFSDQSVDYFQSISNELGQASKYQLLGKFLHGDKIHNLDTQVSAIETKIGPNKCYLFSCDPDLLLKIGYVVHQRDRTNDSEAFQRIVRRSRLNGVKSFIAKGGYFPNSIIINVQPSKSGKPIKPNFESCEPKFNKHSSRVGVLKLPQVYKSAYIIDGQHRLYGYTNLENKDKKHTIPVVAFYNLSSSEQIRIFDDINKTQKAPPAGLLEAIASDMNWDSKDQRKVIGSLKTKILIQLNSMNNSALHERIIIGEDDRSYKKCITVRDIKVNGFSTKTNFFGQFKSKNKIRNGLLEGANKNETLKNSINFFQEIFNYIEKEYPEHWDLGNSPGGFLSINIGVNSILLLINDLFYHEIGENKKFRDNTTDGAQLASHFYKYLDAIISYFKKLSAEKITGMRKQSVGSGGGPRMLGHFQEAVHSKFPDFNPDTLIDWREQESGKYDTPSNEVLDKLESRIKKLIINRLKIEFGQKWWADGVHWKVKSRIEEDKGKEDHNIKKSGKETLIRSKEGFLSILDYVNIIEKNKKLFSRQESVKQYEEQKGKSLDLFYFCPPELDAEQSLAFDKKVNWLKEEIHLYRNRAKHIGSAGPMSKIDYENLISIIENMKPKFDSLELYIKQLNKLK